MGRPPALVGRGGDREAVFRAFAAAQDGQPGVLLVTGEAGIGKTRLVGELLALVDATARAAAVRSGESAPLVGESPAYGPSVAAFRDQSRWLLADDDGNDSRTARHRTFERVLDLVARLSAPSGLLLVLEDLHWADCSPSSPSDCASSRFWWWPRCATRTWTTAAGCGWWSWRAAPGSPG